VPEWAVLTLRIALAVAGDNSIDADQKFVGRWARAAEAVTDTVRQRLRNRPLPALEDRRAPWVQVRPRFAQARASDLTRCTDFPVKYPEGRRAGLVTCTVAGTRPSVGCLVSAALHAKQGIAWWPETSRRPGSNLTTSRRADAGKRRCDPVVVAITLAHGLLVPCGPNLICIRGSHGISLGKRARENSQGRTEAFSGETEKGSRAWAAGADQGRSPRQTTGSHPELGTSGRGARRPPGAGHLIWSTGDGVRRGAPVNSTRGL